MNSFCVKFVVCVVEMTALDYKFEFDQQRSSTTRRSSDRTHRMLRTHQYSENEDDFQFVEFQPHKGCVNAFLLFFL